MRLADDSAEDKLSDEVIAKRGSILYGGCEEAYQELLKNNADIHHYDRSKAKELCKYINNYGKIVLEGHSTDYQSSKSLREMVEDGIAILKVGPALTFALREGLFTLSMIEKELISPENRADFMETLEKVMRHSPENWKKHYSGSQKELKLQRKFSFSDRCRYYFAKPEVIDAINKLFENLQSVDIPLGMLRRFMPMQYIKVRNGKLALNPKELVLDSVVELIESYNYATKHNYMVAEILLTRQVVF
ncbi:hypothetical protein GM661_06875 [Iocasia frigidifontis]|uniref:Uncharacterized protein n=1 Tax=Iocasia fonsfrigidae TaxID=2682810 RepID=A0A8A7KE67_9FIRM|nr:class II D-tagatose-bisphosphate aldolase, non-catalytic subunit [Iocasia fonsfrigidae]QTL97729.1 hypothetical protein GM661_06875 [Iocasia fonsfrigidae]